MLLLLKDVVALVLENFLNICERPCNDFNEEVVHDISVISSVSISRWCSIGGQQNNSRIQFWSIFVLLLNLIFGLVLLLLIGVMSKFTRFVIFEKNIDVIVELYVHLNGIENVKVT